LQYGTSSLATSEPVGLPILRMNNLQDDGWDLTDLKYIDLPAHEAELYRLNPGDILFNRTNSKELVGKCEVFRESGHWVFASYLIRMTLDESKALPEFVSRFLNTKAGRAQIDRVSRQIVGMSNINAEEIRELLIPLPRVEIQKSLVEELEAAREAQQRKLAQADTLIDELNIGLLNRLSIPLPPEDQHQVFAIRLDEMQKRIDSYSNQPRFRKLFQLLRAHQFPAIELHSLATNIWSGTTPTAKGDAYTDESEGIPFIRSGEITKDGVVVEDHAVFIKKEIHEGLMRSSRLKQGDLLIAIVGATIGSVGVYNRSTPANINQAIAAVRLDTTRILPKFARWFLSSPTGQAILDFLKRPVARANINLEEVGDILLLVPPLETQHSVVNQIEEARLQVRRMKEEAATGWAAAKSRFELKLLGEEA
jgi:type I restriction enzyme, S subunit